MSLPDRKLMISQFDNFSEFSTSIALSKEQAKSICTPLCQEAANAGTTGIVQGIVQVEQF
jgi:hypothetical protein